MMEDDADHASLLLVRHGHRADRQGDGSQCKWREECPKGYTYDPWLSPQGRSEASLTGTFIGKQIVSAAPNRAFTSISIVSSPMTRCIETALLIHQSIAATLKDNDDESLLRQMPCSIVAHEGFFELFTAELFPTPPSHVISQSARDMCEAAGVQLVPSSINTEDFLSCWPETKSQSLARVIGSLQRLGDLLCHDGASEQKGPVKRRSLVIVVTHQFGCSAISNFLVKEKMRLDIPSEAQRAPSRNAKKVDWKAYGNLLLASTLQNDCCSPLQRDVKVMDFDVCSLSMFSWRHSLLLQGPFDELRLLSYRDHLLAGVE